ncbi:MAG: N-6 DNA methylase, partial [Sciscionella sp.]
RLHQPSTGRVELDEQGVGPLVLTGRDVATGEAATLRLAAEPASPLPQLRPGDLVVPQLAAGEGQPRPQVITERGLLLGPNLVLLRVDAQRLDVDYLAGQLAAGRAARASGSTVSGVHRLDIRRVEVVVLDLAAQRAVGERFRGLRQLRARLNEVSGLGEQLCARLAEGLATGMITQE